MERIKYQPSLQDYLRDNLPPIARENFASMETDRASEIAIARAYTNVYRALFSPLYKTGLYDISDEQDNPAYIGFHLRQIPDKIEANQIAGLLAKVAELFDEAYKFLKGDRSRDLPVLFVRRTIMALPEKTYAKYDKYRRGRRIKGEINPYLDLYENNFGDITDRRIGKTKRLITLTEETIAGRDPASSYINGLQPEDELVTYPRLVVKISPLPLNLRYCINNGIQYTAVKLSNMLIPTFDALCDISENPKCSGFHVICSTMIEPPILYRPPEPIPIES